MLAIAVRVLAGFRPLYQRDSKPSEITSQAAHMGGS